MSKTPNASREVEEQDNPRTGPESCEHDHPKLKRDRLEKRKLNRHERLVQANRRNNEPDERKNNKHREKSPSPHD